eukprot:m.320675 g.320675  ORF g.320675 m.320675 type:complete len:98 (-) comp27588_c1_seq50:4900-5193(-)
MVVAANPNPKWVHEDCTNIDTHPDSSCNINTSTHTSLLSLTVHVAGVNAGGSGPGYRDRRARAESGEPTEYRGLWETLRRLQIINAQLHAEAPSQYD